MPSFFMKRFLFGLLGIAAVNTGVLGVTAISSWADDSKITKGFNSMDAMGCMLLRECTDAVSYTHLTLPTTPYV